MGSGVRIRVRFGWNDSSNNIFRPKKLGGWTVIVSWPGHYPLVSSFVTSAIKPTGWRSRGGGSDGRGLVATFSSGERFIRLAVLSDRGHLLSTLLPSVITWPHLNNGH